MSQSTITVERRDALLESIAALRMTADYTLPPELDRRILDLGERKETLTADERVELLALVEFTQQRSIDRAVARRALQRLTSVFPEVQTAS
jgi:hypothetical protein